MALLSVPTLGLFGFFLIFSKLLLLAIVFFSYLCRFLPINIGIQIRGELYGHRLIPTKSQALAGGHLRKKIPTGDGLSFCSFEILNTELNKHTQLIQLKKLGFEVPEHKFTNYLSEVDIYRKLWLEGRLFSSYPMDGFVLTVNSRKLQKQLYQYQYAIKC